MIWAMLYGLEILIIELHSTPVAKIITKDFMYAELKDGL